jgi:hypothetical protein
MSQAGVAIPFSPGYQEKDKMLHDITGDFGVSGHIG